MRLYTIQSYDLREFKGPIRLEEGTYKDDPHILLAQRKLYDLIGEDQVVWCDQDQPCLRGEIDRYLHEIEIDRRDIVTILDSLVWNHIIETCPRYIPAAEDQLLRAQARRSLEDFDTALLKVQDEYLAKHLPEDLWSGVTKTTTNTPLDQVLTKCPFRYSEILSVQKITEEFAKAEHLKRKVT